MDYCKNTDTKPNNILSIHENHEKFIQNEMSKISKEHGLVKEDTRLWYKRFRDEQGVEDLYCIKISGSTILQCGANLFLWRRIIVFKKYKPELLLKILLEKLGLNYFHDEDAFKGGMFTGRHKTTQESFAYCYISPDFPEGYWENHSLEVYPIL